jgi:hypothetical protein
MYINVHQAIRKSFETLERDGFKIATYGDNVASTGSKLSIGEQHADAAWVIKWIDALPAQQSLALRLKYGTDKDTWRDVADALAELVVPECGKAEINKAQAYFMLSMWAVKNSTVEEYIHAHGVHPNTATRHLIKVYEIVDRWKDEGIAAIYPRLAEMIEENSK